MWYRFVTCVGYVVRSRQKRISTLALQRYLSILNILPDAVFCEWWFDDALAWCQMHERETM